MVNWLIERAKRTPYFHLDGYMRRWWLVPYNKTILRTTYRSLQSYDDTFGHHVQGFNIVTDDGTGMVSPWRRPFTWCIQKLGFAVRVHEILRSDTGRDPHNHPWPYLTIVLKGGYTEHRYDESGYLISSEWYGPGNILYRPANSWHRLELLRGMPATTLFITGKKCQRWGFNTPEGFVPYDKYPGRND